MLSKLKESWIWNLLRKPKYYITFKNVARDTTEFCILFLSFASSLNAIFHVVTSEILKRHYSSYHTLQIHQYLNDRYILYAMENQWCSVNKCGSIIHTVNIYIIIGFADPQFFMNTFHCSIYIDTTMFCRRFFLKGNIFNILKLIPASVCWGGYPLLSR